MSKHGFEAEVYMHMQAEMHKKLQAAEAALKQARTDAAEEKVTHSHN